MAVLEFAEIRFQEAFGALDDALRTLLQRLLTADELVEFAALCVDFFEQDRSRVVFGLASSPTELAVVREDDAISLIYYSLDAIPKIWFYRKHVSALSFASELSFALETLAKVSQGPVPAYRTRWRMLCEKFKTLDLLAHTRISTARYPLSVTTGDELDPERAPTDPSIAMHFDGLVPDYHPLNGHRRLSEYSDIHSLLFAGNLSIGTGRGQKSMGSGLIFPFLEQCHALIRTGLESFEFRRPMHQRYPGRHFSAGLKLSAQGHASWSFSSAESGSVTLSEISFLLSASSLLSFSKKFVETLREIMPSQNRNLRLAQFDKDRIRLEQSLNIHEHIGSFINQRADYLIHGSASEKPPQPESLIESNAADCAVLPGAEHGHFTLQWNIDLQGLDASVFHPFNNLLIVATPDALVALDRQHGRPVWRRGREGLSSFVSGPYVVSLHPGGDVEFVEAQTGEVAFTAHVPGLLLSPKAAYVALQGLPSSVICCDRHGRVVAIDSRTGAVRWRYASRQQRPVQFTRSGRIVCVVGGDGSIEAVDAVQGEVFWRFEGVERYEGCPVVMGPYVIATAEARHYSKARPGEISMTALDVLAGTQAWHRVIEAESVTRMFSTARGLWLQFRSGDETHNVSLIDHRTGEVLWTLPIDDDMAYAPELAREAVLFLRSHRRVLAIDLRSGRTLWAQSIAMAAQHAPRFQKPSIYRGTLLVPARGVHRYVSETGEAAPQVIAADMIVDRLMVDDQGWAFFAEESGLVRAYRPRPPLRLIKSAG